MTNIPNDKRSLNFGSAFAIQDPETSRLLDKKFNLTDLNNKEIIDRYLSQYDNWIKKGKLNTLYGLDSFTFKCYSNGTTEAFDKFYLRHSTRRFRCFKGEYMYHKLAWRDHFNWAWIEDDVIRENDAVVISIPFADTGGQHPNYNKLMQDCISSKVPVLVDCAYYGICRDMSIDLSHSCITDVTFSLSKTFPVAYARIGIRYTRIDNDDTMFVYHKGNYNNKVGALIGLEYMKTFSPDYIPEKYYSQQKSMCLNLGVQQSNTVLFGIDHNDKYHEYNRGGTTNRLSFHKQYIEDNLSQ